MAEGQQRRHIGILVIAGEEQPHAVACPEPPGVRHQRDTVAQGFADRHRLKGPAWEVGGAGTTGCFVDFTQACPEVARRTLNDLMTRSD